MADQATLLEIAAEKLEKFNEARRAMNEAGRELAGARADLEAHQQATAALIEQLSVALTEEGVAEVPTPNAAPEAPAPEEPKKRAPRKTSKKAEAAPAPEPEVEAPAEVEPAAEEEPAGTPDEDDLGLDDWEVGAPDEDEEPTPAPAPARKPAPAADPDDFDALEF